MPWPAFTWYLLGPLLAVYYSGINWLSPTIYCLYDDSLLWPAKGLTSIGSSVRTLLVQGVILGMDAWSYAAALANIGGPSAPGMRGEG